MLCPFPHLHLGPLYTHDKLWIDQVAGVAAQKSVGTQLLLHSRQHTGHLDHIVDQVVVEPVLDNLHIHQLVRGDAAQPAWGVHRKAALLVHQVDIQCLFEFQGKIVVAHRLEQKAHRVYLVSLQSVLHQVCDEDDRHIFVVPAQFHGGVHAVFPRHLNIQKRHRINGLIVLKELLTVIKPGDIELLAKLGGVPLYVCRKMLSGGIFVLHDGYVLHSSSPLIVSHVSPANSDAPAAPVSADDPLYISPTSAPPRPNQAPVSFLDNTFLDQS